MQLTILHSLSEINLYNDKKRHNGKKHKSNTLATPSTSEQYISKKIAAQETEKIQIQQVSLTTERETSSPCRYYLLQANNKKKRQIKITKTSIFKNMTKYSITY